MNFVAIVERDGWEIESWTERGGKRELERATMLARVES